MVIDISYWTAGLSDGNATHLCSTFCQVLKDLVANPHNTIGEVHRLSSLSMQTIHKWNNLAIDASNECLHTAIAHQGQYQPHSSAISGWDGSFTYAELEAITDKLCQQLSLLNIGPECFVPICFEKSVWAIVSMLAVLKSGGGFVPLHPSYPQLRMYEIINQVHAKVVLTSSSFRGLKLPENITTIEVSSSIMDWTPEVSAISKQRLKVSPNNTAYVLFTSGSTGNPKGVMMEHASAMSGIRAHGKAMHFSQSSRVLQFSAYVFDACIAEIFTTLVHGGCICVPSESSRMNDLSQFIADKQINWAFLTPSVARILEPHKVVSLQTFTIGGEAVGKDIISKWASKSGAMNVYGTTECCVFSTGNVITDTSAPENIGRALSGRCWIVDPNDYTKLMPIGSVGELVIESPAVARCYLNDEKKSMDSFVNVPGSFPLTQDVARYRMYKTGDLVRYTSTGSIWYIGRKDSQIKLNGQRIELCEVEFHLQQAIPNSAQIAVELVCKTNGHDAYALAAFLSLNGCVKSEEIPALLPTSANFQTMASDFDYALAKTLPKHMIPSLFFPVSHLPVTTSGKLDRPMLRKLFSSLSEEVVVSYKFVEKNKKIPVTASEIKMQRIWAQTLRIPDNMIGADDSFFQLGGDSIGAMKLVAAARAEGFGFSVADVFRSPKLWDLCKLGALDSKNVAAPIEPFSLILEQNALDDIRAEVAFLCRIEKAAIEDAYPCSPLQEGLFALSKKQYGAYIAQNIFILPYQTDIKRLEAAWRAVADKEAILRTHIVQTQAAGTLQVVYKYGIQWNESSSLVECLAQHRRLLEVDGEALNQFTIVKDTSDTCRLVWTTHHALYDGWSLPLVLNKVEDLYISNDCASSVPYSRFVQYLKNSDCKEMREYWTSQTTGVSCVEFPKMAHRDQKRKEKRKASHVIKVDALESLVDSEITMSTIIRGAWGVLLAAYSDTEDITFGAILSGRNAPILGISEITGPTITTVPVRIKVKRTMTLYTYLKTIQKNTVDMIPFEHAGLQYIKQLSDDANAACNFQNLLIIQPKSESDYTTELWNSWETVENEDFHTYPLTIECILSDVDVQIKVHYDEALIPHWQVISMLQQLEHVIGQLSSTESHKTVRELTLVTKGEIDLMSEWNSSYENIDRCIHAVIKDQVVYDPQASAICAWDGNFSYQELDQAAEKLASYLVILGVGPDVVVSLCFEKSAWTIVSMLAVLKSGGAYVSLDPSHPWERKKALIDNVEARLLLTSPAQRYIFTEHEGEILYIDSVFVTQLDEPNLNLSICASSKNPAFVVFTSGSSGIPKGIVMEHGAFCSSANAHGPALGINRRSRVLQFAAYTYDVSMGEILTTLMEGGCICVPSDFDRLNDLAGVINRMGVTWTFLTPTVASLLQPSDVESLQVLVLGGEHCRESNIVSWSNKVQLINSYGPAECAIWSACNYGVKESDKPSLIGRRIGSYLWVVDSRNHDRLVPIGCVGELVIEGPILARCYLNNPTKTAESFIYSPKWTNDPNMTRKMYKTGDLVRYNIDGTISIVGRKDSQVKLHGQRLELGEVEYHVKRSLPSDFQYVVELGTRSGSQILATFLCSGNNITSNTSVGTLVSSMTDQLRYICQNLSTTLKSLLPAYMVPSLYIPVKCVPLNLSGKLDRHMLKSIIGSLSDEQLIMYRLSTSPKKIPVTVVEKKLQIIWAKILKISPDLVGAQDNFFHLGGDSVKAMQLVVLARSEDIEVSVASVFRYPILEDMSCVVTTSSFETTSNITPFSLISPSQSTSLDSLIEECSAQCEVAKDLIQDAYPCSSLQQGLIALSSKQNGAYIAQIVYKLATETDITRFRQAWQVVIEKQPILRTRIVHTDGAGILQVVIREKITWLTPDSVPDVLTEKLGSSSLFGKQLSKYSLVTNINNPAERYFVWTLHHALYDGWSMESVLEQVETVYRHGPDRSSTHPVQYSSFIRYLEGIDLPAAHIYWKSYLAEGAFVDFPQCKSYSTAKTRSSSSLSHLIRLPERAHLDITLPNILRGAWAILLSAYTGTSDIVFGSILNGRNTPIPGIDQIVGPTMASVPVRVQIPGEQKVIEFLEKIQHDSVEMMPFEQIGIQNIKALSEETLVACEFQNLFVIRTTHGASDRNNKIWSVTPESVIDDGFQTYPLVIECTIGANGVDVHAQHDPNNLTAEQIQNLLTQLDYIVHQLHKANSDAIVSSLIICSPEAEVIVQKWNGEYLDPVEECLHTIIKRFVISQPNKQAVMGWNGSLTYKELDDFATTLAQKLSDMHVMQEVLVPVCFEKSIWSVVAMLGVLKAGGAFVPLDPSHPISRLQSLAARLDSPLILVSEETFEIGSKINENTIVVSRTTLRQFQEEHSRRTTRQTKAHPDNAAYMIFTSGSTGIPKGVIVNHTAIVTSLTMQGITMGFGKDTRALQFASHGFDAILAEIFATLMHGGCVCIPSEAQRMDNLPIFIEKSEANWAFFTPSYARLLDPLSVPSLKRIILGGEPMTMDDIESWMHIKMFIQGYGPTECCVFCATNGVLQTRPKVPSNIGRVFSGWSWIVDPNSHGRLMPLGSIGELLIEGPILARGYHCDPEKTDASFIEDPPWASKQNIPRRRLMYKTGDLVQYNSDGTLNYIGRKDTQIKLNGKRIELTEIEHQAAKYIPAAAHFSVDLINRKKKKSIVAFICLSPKNNATAVVESALLPMSDDMRSFCVDLESSLSSMLPSFMIPTLFIPLAFLPMTVSGKTNQRGLRSVVEKLPDQDISLYGLVDINKVAPSTPMEEVLASVWEKTLRASPGGFGANDNFFRLGGDSIAAMNMVAAAQLKGISLSVATIFKHPCLAEMALHAEALTKEASTAIDEDIIEPFSLLGAGAVVPLALVAEAAETCRVAQASIEDIYSCSPLQEALIALSTKQHGAYVAHYNFKLPENIDLKRFKKAWSHVVKRQPILRTRIAQTKNLAAVQVVLREPILWKEFASISDANTQTAILPEFPGGSLICFTIAGNADIGYHFIWTIHHALYDGWSLGSVFKEVEAVYENESLSSNTPYVNFIRYLQSIDEKESTNFWGTQLSDATTTPFPRLPQSGYKLNVKDSFSQEITVGQFALTNLTLSTAIRATWAILLASHSGSNEVIFGVTLSGRNAPIPGIMSIAGPTLTTVPLRLIVDPFCTISDFLRRIQDQSTQMIPFEHFGIQKIRQLGQSAAAACEFNNLLVIQPNNEDKTSSLWKIRDGEASDATFHTYPFIIECQLNDSSIVLTMQFDSAIIAKPRVQRMMQQFDEVLQHILNHVHSDCLIGEIDVFSALDKESLLKWEKQSLVEVDECIHSIVTRHSNLNPKETAVQGWDRTFTYSELDELSTRLASYLIAQGVVPGVFIPICFRKSAWTIIAMLAILKSGGAFVPLDPEYPQNRLQNIITQVNASIILVSDGVQKLKLDSSIRLVKIDSTIEQWLITTSVISHPQPHNPAYVLFTSGSTGQPKGVVIEHRAIATSSIAHGAALNFTKDTRALQFASYTFDASITEILTTLVFGGCVCVPSEEDRMGNLSYYIRSTNINWALLTPTLISLIQPSEVSCLKTLVSGGEAINEGIIKKWAGSSTQLMHAYGPTECSVICIAGAISSPNSPKERIGRSVGGRSWIVDIDNYHKLAPLGATGELAIEGPILARGYLNDDQRTSESFITNPKWMLSKLSEERRRLYRTGDLVTYNEDGTINFIGRKDSQVKLRGQRLELGDIEQNMISEDYVKHGIVILPTSGICKGKLVAIIDMNNVSTGVSTAGALEIVDIKSGRKASRQVSNIRAAISKKLPPHMVPTIWVAVKNISVLSSGKLDRKGATQWIEDMDEQLYFDIIHLGIEEEIIIAMPETSVEEIFHRAVAHILNLEPKKVSMNESFLTCGGDSVTAMQLVAYCKAIDIGTTVKDILQANSIRELALLNIKANTISYVEETDQDFQLSPIQKLYMDQMGPDRGRFNQSFLLEVFKTVKVQDLQYAIATISRKHAMLRARFNKQHSVWSQRINKTSEGSSNFQAHEVYSTGEIREAIAASQDSLNIQAGPLLAVDFFNLGSRQFLFLTAHHLVIDLVSWRIILNELQILLTSGTIPKQIPLPFSQWILSQATQTDDTDATLPYTVVPANLSYWGMKDVPNIYRDTVHETWTVDLETTTLLLGNECNKVFNTLPVDIFMASLIHSFNETFTDRTVPALYSESHGRDPSSDDFDPSQTIGWFTTIFPLQLTISKDDTIIETLQAVKDMRRAVSSKGRNYFASLLKTSKKQQDHQAALQMEIIFNYLGQYQQFERDDALFRPVDSDFLGMDSPQETQDIDPRVPRFALFEISVTLIKERGAELSIIFNRHMQHHDRIRSWISNSVATIQTVIKQLTCMEGKRTLSDFPLIPYSQDGLGRLIRSRLPRIGLHELDKIEDIYPCAPMQQGILVSQTRDPHNYAVRMVCEVTASGSLSYVDSHQLASAWQFVIHRHPALRTIFVECISNEGLYDQIVLKDVINNTIVVHSVDDADALVLLEAQESIEHGEAKPTHQLTICTTTTKRVLCKLDINHAIMDGTSMQVIFRDLALAYEGTLGQEIGASPLYSEYIRYIQNQNTTETIDYWTKYLSGAELCHVPVLDDGIKHVKQLASLNLTIDNFPELQDFCKRNSFTVSNILQVAWGLVLKSYTGLDEVCFGYLASGRDTPLEGIQDAVGAFVNMLVCRLDLPGECYLTEILQNVQNDYLKSLPHQTCSLAHIQHAIGLSGKALFNTLVSFQRRLASSETLEPCIKFEYADGHDPTEVCFHSFIKFNINSFLVRYYNEHRGWRNYRIFLNELLA